MSPGEWAMLFANLSAVTAQNREELAASEALIENADAVLASEYQKALDKAKPGVAEQILPTVAGIVAAPFTAGMSIPAAMAVTGGAVAAGHAGGQLIDKGRVDARRALTSGAISGATAGLSRGLDKGLDWLGNKAATMKDARVAEGQKLAGVEEGFETETGLDAAAKVKEMTPKAGFKERLYSGLSSDTGRAAMARAIDNIAMQYLRPGTPDVPIPRGLRPQTQLAIQQQRMAQQEMADQAAYQQEMLGLQRSELGLREDEITQRGQLAKDEMTQRGQLTQAEIDARATEGRLDREANINEIQERGKVERQQMLFGNKLTEDLYEKYPSAVPGAGRRGAGAGGGRGGGGGRSGDGIITRQEFALRTLRGTVHDDNAVIIPGEEGSGVDTGAWTDPNTGETRFVQITYDPASGMPQIVLEPTPAPATPGAPGTPPAPETPPAPGTPPTPGPVSVRSPEEQAVIDEIDYYGKGLRTKAAYEGHPTPLPDTIDFTEPFRREAKSIGAYYGTSWNVSSARENLDKVALYQTRGGVDRELPLSSVPAVAKRYGMSVPEFLKAIRESGGYLPGSEEHGNERFGVYGSPVWADIQKRKKTQR